MFKGKRGVHLILSISLYFKEHVQESLETADIISYLSRNIVEVARLLFKTKELIDEDRMIS